MRRRKKAILIKGRYVIDLRPIVQMTDTTHAIVMDNYHNPREYPTKTKVTVKYADNEKGVEFWAGSNTIAIFNIKRKQCPENPAPATLFD